MIAPLRRRHRWMSAALLVLLPVGYVSALLARPEMPHSNHVPVAAVSDPAVGVLLHEDVEALDGRVIVRVLEGEPRTGPPVLELEPVADLQLPDVLVYWSSAATPQASSGVELPKSARLLGTLSGVRARRFALPRAVRDGASSILLYSLAHAQIVGAQPLPEFRSDHR